MSLWLLLSTLLNLTTTEHFVTAPHSGWRSHWHHKELIKLLKSKRSICRLMARWLVGHVLSLENHEAVAVLQWWVLTQDSLRRSEQQDLHVLLQLWNVSLETKQLCHCHILQTSEAASSNSPRYYLHFSVPLFDYGQFVLFLPYVFSLVY